QDHTPSIQTQRQIVRRFAVEGVVGTMAAKVNEDPAEEQPEDQCDEGDHAGQTEGPKDDVAERDRLGRRADDPDDDRRGSGPYHPFQFTASCGASSPDPTPSP